MVTGCAPGGASVNIRQRTHRLFEEDEVKEGVCYSSNRHDYLMIKRARQEREREKQNESK